MRIFFSVGEPSGDLHGANLIRDLELGRPDIKTVGFGGPRMAAAGCELLQDMTGLAVMGIVRVIPSLAKFARLRRLADAYFREQRPDAVVLIDYPGFNWWVARSAKKYGIPVFYYGVPQMWAWASWRVRKMRRLVDHALCKLPFEATWYRERGCHATYVGHPYFDEMERQRLDGDFVAGQQSRPEPLVVILPGSRRQEVTGNLPWLLKTAARVREQAPHCRFAIASYNDAQADMARHLVAVSGLPIDVHVGRTPELIHVAKCCLACSGSVSLELLYHTTPTVVQYRISRLVYFLALTPLIRINYMTLVNLLAVPDPFVRDRRPYDPAAPGADNVPMPEYPTYWDRSEQMAEHVVRWLLDDVEFRRRKQQLTELKTQFCRSGASRTAADYVLSQLCQRPEGQLPEGQRPESQRPESQRRVA